MGCLCLSNGLERRDLFGPQAKSGEFRVREFLESLGIEVGLEVLERQRTVRLLAIDRSVSIQRPLTIAECQYLLVRRWLGEHLERVVRLEVAHHLELREPHLAEEQHQVEELELEPPQQQVVEQH